MEKAYGNFMVYIENDVEQKELMNILAARGFHWMSGHIANDIPVLLRLLPESKGQILSIDMKKKTIRFVPTEGYDPAEDTFRQILNDTITMKEVRENIPMKTINIWCEVACSNCGGIVGRWYKNADTIRILKKETKDWSLTEDGDNLCPECANAAM